MKHVVAVFILLFTAQAVFADITLTDKSSALKIIGQAATPLTPEQKQQIRDANAAKRAIKRARKGKPVKSPSTEGFTPRADATGSISLIDSGGLKYFINTNITFSTSSSASGAASEASYTAAVMASTSAGGVVSSTLNDAFDGYHANCVSLTNATGPCATGDANYVMYNQNGPASVDATVPVTPECTGRQYVFPAKLIGAISVQRKVYVPTNDQFIRWMDSFTNTSGAPVTFTTIVSNNLGSDSNTTIVSSSSGDAVAQTTDTWVSTFQNYSGATSSDPRIGHVLQGAGAATPVSNISFANGDDNPFWSYSITLNPGQTKTILNYATGQPSKAAANAKAAALALLPTVSTQCMSATELAQTTNFVSIPQADLSITKNASAGSVPTGSPFTYTINVNNAGPSTANAVSVSDVLPAGVFFVSASGTGWTCGNTANTVTCTIPSLGVGAANPITINVVAGFSTGVTNNTATVSSTTSDPTPANNTSAAVTVNLTPGVAIPLLDPKHLAMLAVLLAAIAVTLLRRS